MIHISGTNIALGKPTHQGPYDYCATSNPWRVCKQWESDTCAGCFGSDLAVDGNTDRVFTHRSCAHTDTYTNSTHGIELKTFSKCQQADIESRHD